MSRNPFDSWAARLQIFAPSLLRHGGWQGMSSTWYSMAAIRKSDLNLAQRRYRDLLTELGR